MAKAARQMCSDAERLLVATSDWTGAIAAALMPSYNHKCLPMAELLRRINRRAGEIERQNMLDRHDMQIVDGYSTLQMRMYKAFIPYCVRNRKGIKANFLFERLRRPWGRLMLEGFIKLRHDLSAFELTKRSGLNKLPGLLDAVFMHRLSAAPDIAASVGIEYSHNNSETQRMSNFLDMLVRQGYLAKEVTGQSHRQANIFYLWNHKSRNLQEFYMTTLHPLARFTSLAARIGSRYAELGRRALSGGFNLRYIYVDDSTRAGKQGAIERGMLTSSATPRDMLCDIVIHSKSTYREPTAPADVYIDDLRERGSEATPARFAFWLDKTRENGTVIAVTDAEECHFPPALTNGSKVFQYRTHDGERTAEMPFGLARYIASALNGEVVRIEPEPPEQTQNGRPAYAWDGSSLSVRRHEQLKVLATLRGHDEGYYIRGLARP